MPEATRRGPFATDVDADPSGDQAQTWHPKELRRVYGTFPSGVTAVAALVDGTPVGLAASSFTSVSLEPALVSVCADLKSSTWPILRTRQRLGISVLAAHQQQQCIQLSSKKGDRFADLQFRTTPDDALFVEDASAWLDCSIENVFPAGDHDIILFRVHDLDADTTVPLLVFHASGFRQLVGWLGLLVAHELLRQPDL